VKRPAIALACRCDDCDGRQIQVTSPGHDRKALAAAADSDAKTNGESGGRSRAMDQRCCWASCCFPSLCE
jgi:hypothetical protein